MNALEIWTVCNEVHHHLYVARDLDEAIQAASRLHELLDGMPSDDGSIVLAEARALLSELKGDLHAAVRFRRREIEMMERLHESLIDAEDAVRAYALRGREESVLAERRTLLALLEVRLDAESATDDVERD